MPQYQNLILKVRYKNVLCTQLIRISNHQDPSNLNDYQYVCHCYVIASLSTCHSSVTWDERDFFSFETRALTNQIVKYSSKAPQNSLSYV